MFKDEPSVANTVTGGLLCTLSIQTSLRTIIIPFAFSAYTALFSLKFVKILFLKDDGY